MDILKEPSFGFAPTAKAIPVRGLDEVAVEKCLALLCAKIEECARQTEILGLALDLDVDAAGRIPEKFRRELFQKYRVSMVLQRQESCSNLQGVSLSESVREVVDRKWLRKPLQFFKVTFESKSGLDELKSKVFSWERVAINSMEIDIDEISRLYATSHAVVKRLQSFISESESLTRDRHDFEVDASTHSFVWSGQPAFVVKAMNMLPVYCALSTTATTVEMGNSTSEGWSSNR